MDFRPQIRIIFSSETKGNTKKRFDKQKGLLQRSLQQPLKCGMVTKWILGKSPSNVCSRTAAFGFFVRSAKNPKTQKRTVQRTVRKCNIVTL